MGTLKKLSDLSARLERFQAFVPLVCVALIEFFIIFFFMNSNAFPQYVHLTFLVDLKGSEVEQFFGSYLHSEHMHS